VIGGRLGINLGSGTDGSVFGWGNLLGAITGIAGLGVVTIVVSSVRLRVITVEWEDVR
jgi:hypothetical protein